MVTRRFYWKQSPKGNAKYLIEFMHQIRLTHRHRKLVFIMDNVSFHVSRKLKSWLKRYPEIMVIHLPTYSPEYNPIEQIWRWLKPLIYGAKALMNGLKELIGRLRVICWHWREGRMINPLKVGHGVWNQLL